MRQRITYLLPAGAGVDPADIRVGQNDLTYAKSNEVAEERRITVDLSDLPDEVSLTIPSQR
jgi:hypothetical protein